MTSSSQELKLSSDKVPKFDLQKFKDSITSASKKAAPIPKKIAEILDALDMVKYIKIVFSLVGVAKESTQFLLKNIPKLEKNERELLMTIHTVVYEKVITKELLNNIFSILDSAKNTTTTLLKSLSKFLESARYEDFAKDLIKSFSSGISAFKKIKEIKNIDINQLKLIKTGGSKEEILLDEKFYKKKAMKYKKKYLSLKEKIKNQP